MQPLSESLYQLAATVFIITYVIVEAEQQAIVLRCVSQERDRDETNGRGVKLGQAGGLI